MPDILVRDVDPIVIKKLKERAKLYGTSLQTEARQAIEGTVRYTREEFIEVARRCRERTPPGPQTDSVELIREMRRERYERLGREEESCDEP